ncbi:MAG: S1C family serine protease [Acutalibacteraceae bacterium]
MSDEFELNKSEKIENTEQQTANTENGLPNLNETQDGENPLSSISEPIAEPHEAEQPQPFSEEHNNTVYPFFGTTEPRVDENTPIEQPMFGQEENIQNFRNPYINNPMRNFPQPPFYSPVPPQNGYSQQPYGNYNGYNMPPVPPQQNVPMYNMNGMYGPYMPVDSNTPTKKKHTGLKIFAFCGTLVVTAALVAGVVYILFQSDNNVLSIPDGSSTPSQVSSIYQGSTDLESAPDVSADINGPQISTQSTPETETKTPAITAYQSASPSVVGITSYQAGSDVTITQDGQGSGIVLTENGYIATNSHVVNDSKNTGVMVTLSDGNQYLGTIIGVDTKTDIAVIKIDAKDLTAATFADSNHLIIGQAAYAIGNPGGLEFSNSLTQGTISALERSLSSNGYVRYIQTDAAINPGNSGGALINEYGQVIGMNTAKIVGTDYEGMGFAIPSNQVLEIVNKLIKYGYVNDRATLAIEGKTCSLYTSKTTGVPQGMILTNIKTESPLFKTSAITGDIIIQIDDTKITSAVDVIDTLKNYKPNDQITIKLYRTRENSPTGAYEYDLTINLISETND